MVMILNVVLLKGRFLVWLVCVCNCVRLWCVVLVVIMLSMFFDRLYVIMVVMCGVIVKFMCLLL